MSDYDDEFIAKFINYSEENSFIFYNKNEENYNKFKILVGEIKLISYFKIIFNNYTINFLKSNLKNRPILLLEEKFEDIQSNHFNYEKFILFEINDQLTFSEKQIVELIYKNYSQKEIAYNLNVSPQYISKTYKKILLKLENNKKR